MKSETKNWMYDQVKATCEKGLSQDELINQLTIQKIEYGRDCIAQFLSMTIGKSEEEMEKIQESTSGGETKQKVIIEKAKKVITDIAKEFKSKEKEIVSLHFQKDLVYKHMLSLFFYNLCNFHILQHF